MAAVICCSVCIMYCVARSASRRAGMPCETVLEGSLKEALVRNQCCVSPQGVCTASDVQGVIHVSCCALRQRGEPGRPQVTSVWATCLARWTLEREPDHLCVPQRSSLTVLSQHLPGLYAQPFPRLPLLPFEKLNTILLAPCCRPSSAFCSDHLHLCAVYQQRYFLNVPCYTHLSGHMDRFEALLCACTMPPSVDRDDLFTDVWRAGDGSPWAGDANTRARR